MSIRLSQVVSLAALVAAASWSFAPAAHACTDSGMPVVGPREPFDAGPGCTTTPDSCGVYRAVCPPDAGPDTGPPMCSELRDTGVDGTPQRSPCTRDEDCPLADPAMVCGGEGFCVCAAPAGGCSVGAPRPSGAWAIMALAAWAWTRRRRRA